MILPLSDLFDPIGASGIFVRYPKAVSNGHAKKKIVKKPDLQRSRPAKILKTENSCRASSHF
jgi:hypothetical protein